jgi:hypothetical protein
MRDKGLWHEEINTNRVIELMKESGFYLGLC